MYNIDDHTDINLMAPVSCSVYSVNSVSVSELRCDFRFYHSVSLQVRAQNLRAITLLLFPLTNSQSNYHKPINSH